MTSKSARHGFTLIELLIVIAVIAGLTVMGLITYPGAQKSARDARRKSDITQYQTSLEVFANKGNGLYPTSAQTTNFAALCTVLGLTSCINDPQSSATYTYRANATGSEYVIYATLERQESGVTQYWAICSNGNKGKTATAPSSSTCPSGLTP
jgi:prepilin-type N-terminal cleavage/methylation domain-containing protein